MDHEHVINLVRAARLDHPDRRPVAVELGPDLRSAAEASIGSAPLIQVDGLRVVPVEETGHVALLFEDA